MKEWELKGKAFRSRMQESVTLLLNTREKRVEWTVNHTKARGSVTEKIGRMITLVGAG